MKKYDSIIFDLDGTIWDSVECVVAIWNNALVEAGIEPTMTYDELSRCMGLRIEQIFDQVIPQATKAQREIVKASCKKNEQKYLAEHGGILYDKVEQTLETLSQTHRLFIVSNCEDSYINGFFQAHGLRRFFEDYECAGRTGLSKGKNIALIVERNKLNAPVYIGDTLTDYEAAVQADVPFIHAAYGFGELGSAITAAKSFEEIIQLV